MRPRIGGLGLCGCTLITFQSAHTTSHGRFWGVFPTLSVALKFGSFEKRGRCLILLCGYLLPKVVVPLSGEG